MAQAIDPEILAGFLDEVRGYLPRIARGLAVAGGERADLGAIKEAHRLIHSIKGASAMVGLAPLSHMASYAEQALDEIHEGRRVYDAPIQALLGATLERIETCLDASGGDQLAATVTEFRRWRGLPADGDAAELAALAETEPASGASSAWEYAASSAWGETGPDLLATFLEEADEHLQKISASLRALVEDAANRAALLDVRRSVHTLKGAASLVGFDELSRLAHRMEDLLDGLADGGEEPSTEDLALLHATADRLTDLAAGGSPETVEIAKIYRRYDERLPRPAAEPPGRRRAAALVPTAAAPTRSRQATLRVPLPRLDEVVRLGGELVIHRSVFERHVAALARNVDEMRASHERLRRLAKRLETDFEGRVFAGAAGSGSSGRAPSLAPRRPAVAAEDMPPPGFDALEFDRYTELHLLSMELGESASDLSAVSAELAASLGDFDGDLTRLGRLSSDLQNRLMRLRMVPLSQLSSPLHRAVRATAEREGKQVDLEVEGETVELDKTVLEALAEPLLHLLRNAVAHGIEPAALRRASAKPERGRIRVQASQEGTQVTVRVSDDGGGMDAQALVASAVAAGHLAAAEAAALSYDQAIELSFLPGLSTAGALSEVSGRGVGLDVVRAGAQRANGTVSVRSTPGHGTTFAIRLPMTLSVARVLMVRVSGESFAVPLGAVVQIQRVERTAIERIDGAPVLILDGRAYPYLHLGDRLRLTPAAEVLSPQVPVLILALGERRAALAVDQVGQAREVVSKSLGPLLRRVPGISGATLTGDGEVVLIVNPGELIGAEGREWSGLPARPEDASSAGAEAARALQVLVVDDSLSVRRVLANLLRGVGWNPVPARDGLEALELLEGADQAPDAILLDIEMPRMDGYELTARLRGMPEFAAVPIVILSSRAGEKHRRRAFELGATDYLVKPYEAATLVATVRRVARRGLPT